MTKKKPVKKTLKQRLTAAWYACCLLCCCCRGDTLARLREVAMIRPFDGFNSLTAGQKVLCASAAVAHVWITAVLFRIWITASPEQLLETLYMLLTGLGINLLCIMSKDVPDKIADAVKAWAGAKGSK
jgi:hypothetical protein